MSFALSLLAHAQATVLICIHCMIGWRKSFPSAWLWAEGVHVV